MKKIYFSLIFALMINTVHASGPWPQPKGKGYFKLYEWWINFDQYYTSSGNIQKYRNRSINNTGIYAEYGFSSKLTGILNFPFICQATGPILYEDFVENLPSDYKVRSIGDADLGIKFCLTENKIIPVSLSFILGLPFSQRQVSGDKEFSQMIQLDIGTSFKIAKNISNYTSVSNAIKKNTCYHSDELRFGFETRFGFLENRLLFTASLNSLSRLNNANSTNVNWNVGFYENNAEFSSYSFELSYYFYKRLGVSFNYTNPYKAKLTAAAPSYSVGVLYDFNK